MGRFATVADVTCHVKGPRLERFINECLMADIPLLHTERVSDNLLVVTLAGAHFRRLRALPSRRLWHIHIIQRHGWGFTVTKMVRRRWLVLFGLVALLLWQAATSYVLVVSIAGNEHVPREEIIQLARSAGVYPGAKIVGLDADDVQRSLILGHNDIVWVGVERRGTRIVLHIAERPAAEIQGHHPGNIVATRAGVIENIVAWQGQAVVAAGDTVVKGQTLISGLLPEGIPGVASFSAVEDDSEWPMYVRAAGSVKATVWYESTAEAVVRGEGRSVAERQAVEMALDIVAAAMEKSGAVATRQPVINAEYDTELQVMQAHILVQAIEEIGNFLPIGP